MFTAVFEGNGRTIANLYIDRPNRRYVGLFGTIGPGGHVRNFGLSAPNSDCQVKGFRHVGPLAGKAGGGRWQGGGRVSGLCDRRRDRHTVRGRFDGLEARLQATDQRTAANPAEPPGHTVDAQVVAKVRALASQTQHGTSHVNRWNRVLVAFGEHDGTGITDGPMTAAQAQHMANTHSSTHTRRHRCHRSNPTTSGVRNRCRQLQRQRHRHHHRITTGRLFSVPARDYSVFQRSLRSARLRNLPRRDLRRRNPA
ncbi:MAG: hypothetical protein OXT07_11245 [bacterium]|nr:hypothetical protein [bacterium]